MFFDSFKQTINNRPLIISKLLLYFVFIFIFSYFWKSVFNEDRDLVYSYTELIRYLSITEWILISIPEIQIEIESDFRTGNISYFLTKPLSYVSLHFAQGLGVLTAHLLVISVFGWIPIAYIMGFMDFNISSITVSLIVGVFAGMLGLLFQILIGLTAFWFQEVAPVNWVWQKLLFMFGGLLIPLKFYPEWIQKIALRLPFSAILNQPAELLIHYSDHQSFVLSLILLGWIFLIFCIITVLYSFARKSITIYNG